MRTGNPTLNAKTFTGLDRDQGLPLAQSPAELMTLRGTVVKSFVLLGLVIACAAWPWYLYFSTNNPVAVLPFMIGGVIGGLILALVTCFNKKAAPITAPLYAAAEGLALGGISAYYEAQYAGIVINAVGLTFGTFFALLCAYSSGLIKASENFKLGIVAATGGIFLVYLVSFVLGFFHITVPLIHGSGPVAIGFSAFIVVIAALNLVLDFDFVESGVEQRAPKYMEWYGAFGLIVTLVWLYLEILRLLSKIASRK